MQRAPPAQKVESEIRALLAQYQNVYLYHYRGNDAKQLGLLLNGQIPSNFKIFKIGFPFKTFITKSEEGSTVPKKKRSFSLKGLHQDLPDEESSFKQLKCAAPDHNALVDTVKFVEVALHWIKKFSLAKNESLDCTAEWAQQQLSGLISQHEEIQKISKKRKRTDGSTEATEETSAKKPRTLDAARAEKLKTFLISKQIDIPHRVLKQHLREYLEQSDKTLKKSATLEELATLVGSSMITQEPEPDDAL